MFKHRMFLQLFEKRTCGVNMKHLWTSDNVVKSPFKDIVIPDMPITEYMWRNVEKWSDKTATICGITDRKYTYNDIYKQSKKIGATLRKKFNIKDGDAVAIMLPNLPEYPTVILGILSAGGLTTTLNPLYTSYEVQRQLLLSKPKVVVSLPENVPLLKEALKGSKLDIPIIVMDVMNERPDDTVSFKEIIGNDVDLDVLNDVKVTVDDVSLLLYSSGTTGLPKGVELTNKNMIANFEQQNDMACRHYADTTETNQDVVLAYLPMFHSYGISINMLHKLSVGLKLVTLPKFQPNTFVTALEKHNFNIFYMAPPTVLFLASNPEVKTKHFEKLQFATVGAASTPMSDVEKFLDKVGHEMHFGQAYGLTETSPLATILPVGAKDYDSVGNALSNVELRIVDGDLNSLGPNELGELLIKGPNVMKGYKDNEEANRQIFIDNDWLRTGDLAKINEKGTVIIADRLKELIKVNAFQVPPAELENVLKEHPAILDVAVIGIPDDKTGEKPKAYIVLNKGAKVSAKEIMDFVGERVAPFKKLKEVKFVDSILKNMTGKILRRVLLEEHLKGQS